MMDNGLYRADENDITLNLENERPPFIKLRDLPANANNLLVINHWLYYGEVDSDLLTPIRAWEF